MKKLTSALKIKNIAELAKLELVPVIESWIAERVENAACKGFMSVHINNWGDQEWPSDSKDLALQRFRDNGYKVIEIGNHSKLVVRWA